jgi:hypothetical protein
LPAGRSASAGEASSGDALTRKTFAADSGNHQFQRPKIFIALGTSNARMIVTSIRIAAARPRPNCWKARSPGSRTRGRRKIELTVVGDSRYSDSPTNGAYLIDADGQQFDADITSPVGPSFGGSSKIASGDSRTGFVTFELPKNAKPATFQFALDSGFGPETDEWEL